ncbi:hypothetical protein DSCOOX_37270 [Desulfosarcina ovata subsp. ovata]|uniref:Transposase n=3 Tax=Desulfosarcina ovata TaxID=83564 RepID=A0A5K8AAP3_9BACT|nr:hypothetical protein DSCOOX_27690 [Desulfosarcina ovata subsp. ovata]BBO90547.1 hypothetical protein DSCOOX_37270 [Desulfosarcina ovata subsp. ovata]
MPNCNAGYDLMVFVGRQRLLEHRQREEIMAALNDDYGIRISAGEVSDLAMRFSQYFLRLHYAKADRIRKILENDGGWPMHIDASGENGRGTLFVVMAGWRKWVLGAWKIATEKAELILPCLRDTVERFGPPCAGMRDLGRAVTPALNDLVSELGLEIPVLACHQHFLADIGKDLLNSDHCALRDLFRRTKVQADIKRLIREFGGKIGLQIDDARQTVIAWQEMEDHTYQLPPGKNGIAVVRALSQWVIDYHADASGLDFPFDRPYFDFFNRCMIGSKAIDAFLRIPSDDRKVTGALKRLGRILTKVACEVPFRHIIKRLQRRAELFDELRDQLRTAKKLPENETVADIDLMRKRFYDWTASLKERRPKRGPAQDMRDAIDIILKHIDVHGEHLWGHVITLPENAPSRMRLVSRTNEIIENFFGTIKHGERRRSGRKNLTHDFERLPAEAALVYNLNQPDYVSAVCGSIDRLPLAFAQLDKEEARRKEKGLPSQKMSNLDKILQLSTSSLSSADRHVVRTENMNQRIIKAARSRAPHVAC